MEKRRKRRKYDESLDPNIAVYLDELDMTEDEFYDELEKEVARGEKQAHKRRQQRLKEQKRQRRNSAQKQRPQRAQYYDDDGIENYHEDTSAYIHKRQKTSHQRSNPKPKKKKKKKSGLRTLLFYLLAFLLIIQIPMFYGIIASFRLQRFSTGSTISNTKGILILGVDNDGDINTGHTDSITYLAANFKTNEAIALPIYRDANIMQRCTGTTENINRVYGANGIKCLVESTADFLGLPVDYYALVTINGLINIIDGLGTVEITPTGTYCSDYGEDGVNYCFTEGQTQAMTGPQALAYIRYRGEHSGEDRANRQMELIMAIKDECMDNLLVCYAKATPRLPGGARTNIPVTELLSVSHIFTSKFQLETLEVLQGTNTTNEAGWTQYVYEYDLQNKAAIIRERIFV